MAERARELPEKANRINQRFDTDNYWHRPDVGKEALNGLIRSVVRCWVLFIWSISIRRKVLRCTVRDECA